MKVPEGLTEAQIVDATNRCADILSSQFKFGYYSEDDIRQECHLEAIKLLNKGLYDPTRPLENYIFRHLKNRLINLTRNKFRRADPPCSICHSGEGCERGSYCRKYQMWLRRNNDKSSLVNPMQIQDDEKLVDSVVEYAAQQKEFLKKLDEELTVDQRVVWRKLLDGVTVTKKKRLELYEVIKDIIEWRSQKEQ